MSKYTRSLAARKYVAPPVATHPGSRGAFKLDAQEALAPCVTAPTLYTYFPAKQARSDVRKLRPESRLKVVAITLPVDSLVASWASGKLVSELCVPPELPCGPPRKPLPTRVMTSPGDATMAVEESTGAAIFATGGSKTSAVLASSAPPCTTMPSGNSMALCWWWAVLMSTWRFQVPLAML